MDAARKCGSLVVRRSDATPSTKAVWDSDTRGDSNGSRERRNYPFSRKSILRLGAGRKAGLAREAFRNKLLPKGAALADIDSKKGDGHSAGLCSLGILQWPCQRRRLCRRRRSARWYCPRSSPIAFGRYYFSWASSTCGLCQESRESLRSISSPIPFRIACCCSCCGASC